MRRVSKYTGVYERISKTRRHNGRPDSCFYVTLKVDGKTKWVKIGWRSEEINAAFAARRRTDLLNESRHGILPNPAKRKAMPLQAAYDLWFNVHAKVNLKSAQSSAHHWASLVEPHLGGRALDEISPLDLEQCKAKLQEAGYSPQTIKHGLGLIRRIYRKMIAWGKYDGPVPTAKVAMPVVSNKRERWLTPHESRLLLGKIRKRSQEMYRLSLISLHTGMRWGEMAALRGENINLPASTIRVQDAKSGTDRTVYVTPAAALAFQGIPLRAGQLVFPSRTGGVRAAPSDTFERCVDELKLNDGVEDRRDKVVFHTLRHTFGSWLAMSGVPLYTIAKLMGHSDQETTQRYAHLCPDVQRLAIDHMQRLFHSKDILTAQSADGGRPGKP
jgi:integrase